MVNIPLFIGFQPSQIGGAGFRNHPQYQPYHRTIGLLGLQDLPSTLVAPDRSPGAAAEQRFRLTQWQ